MVVGAEGSVGGLLAHSAELADLCADVQHELAFQEKCSTSSGFSRRVHAHALQLLILQLGVVLLPSSDLRAWSVSVVNFGMELEKVVSMNDNDVRLERNMKKVAYGCCTAFEILQSLSVIHLIKHGKHLSDVQFRLWSVEFIACCYFQLTELREKTVICYLLILFILLQGCL